MPITRPAAMALAVTLCLSTAGCSAPDAGRPDAKSTGAAAGYPVTLDNCGREETFTEAPSSVGAVTVPLGEVWAIVWCHVTGTGTPPADRATDQIVWNFRTPRVVLAALVGAGLAVSGAVLQTVVDNPLADPIVLGFSYGATLGAVLVITLGGGAVLAGLGVSAAAFAGGGSRRRGSCSRASPWGTSSSPRPATSSSRRRRPNCGRSCSGCWAAWPA